jgi:hypothetical protein
MFDLVAGRNGQPAAMDVHFDLPEQETVDLKSHRELSTLVRWVPALGVGYAQRQSGDWLSVSYRDESLKLSSQIWHAIKFKKLDGEIFDPNAPLTGRIDPKIVVAAAKIEIVRPAEETPLEVPKVEPVVPVQSVLLTDRFKKLKLRHIGVRKS